MKNKSKRIVSAVTALCLAGGIINTGIVFPVNKGGVVFAEPDGSAGKDISKAGRVTRHVISTKEPVSLTNGVVTLFYESDKLNVKNVEVCSQMKDMLTNINTDTPGRIVFGFASSKPLKISGDMFYADFEHDAALKEIPQFGFRVNELETEDAAGNTVEADKGSLTANGVRSYLFLSTSSRTSTENCFRETSDGEYISFALQLGYEPLSAVTNGECVVKYDPEVMQFVSLREKEGIIAEANETEPGTVRLTFASDKALSDGVLTDLNFKPLKNTVSDIYLITNELTAVLSENYILDSAPYYNDRFRFGIDIPELSDGLKNNRKASVRLYTDKNFSVTNGLITVSYNGDNLKFRDIRLGESLKNVTTDVNTSVPGKIVIGFVSTEPFDSGEVIADIDFVFPSGLSDTILDSVRYNVNELETETADGKTVNVAPENIKLSTRRTYYDVLLKQENASDDVTAVIKLDNNSGVTDGSFTLSFDPETVKFDGVSPAEGQKLLTDANETEPGKVKCVFLSDKSVTSDGELLYLKFKPLRSGFARFVFDPLELSNTVSEEDIYEYPLRGGRIDEIFNVQAGGSAIVTEPVVTTAENPVTSAAPVTTVNPVTSAVPASTTVNSVTTAAVNPVTSAAPVTTAAPVTSAVPAVTTVNPVTAATVNPVTSAAPVTAVNPVTSAVPAVTTVKPVTTATVNPVTSAAPVTAVNPVTSAAPTVTTVKPVTTATVNPVTSAAPVTAVNPVTSAVPSNTTVNPVTTAAVNPVTSAAPVTAVNPVTSAVPANTTVKPVTTAAVNPVTSAAPVTAVNPVTSAVPAVTTVKPVTTATVNPVTSAAPVTAVNPVTSAVPANTTVNPVTTAAVNPVTSEAPVTGTAVTTAAPPVTAAVTTPAPAANIISGSVRVGSDDKISVTKGKIELTYDPDKMTFEGIELSDEVRSRISELSTSEPGKIVIGFDSKEPFDLDKIADINFRYADSIEDPASVCKVEVQKLETVDETGAVKYVVPELIHVSQISQNIRGDINGDDSVTVADLVTLAKMIIGTEKTNAASDMNGDGKTDSADILVLKKILMK